jgi:hypothetical protein
LPGEYDDLDMSGPSPAHVNAIDASALDLGGPVSALLSASFFDGRSLSQGLARSREGLTAVAATSRRVAQKLRSLQPQVITDETGNVYEEFDVSDVEFARLAYGAAAAIIAARQAEAAGVLAAETEAEAATLAVTLGQVTAAALKKT